MLATATAANATVFGYVHGIVHDPQHRPIKGAQIKLRAGHSFLTFSATSSADGSFQMNGVPLGDYVASVVYPGFADYRQTVTVTGDSGVTLHLQLEIANVSQSVNVENVQNAADVDSVYSPNSY